MDPAFGPLDARPGLQSDAPDRIALRDAERVAEVGAFGAERGVRQALRFSVVVEVARRAPDDDVDATLSYDRLSEAIDGALAGGRADLLETLAERVAEAVLREPQASRAFVRVEKPREGGALGVEIVRDRTGGPVAEPLRPVVMALGADVPDLGALDGPTILCVGAPGLPLPEAAAPSHAHRIAALAVDQAAWALAARVPGLHVVSTRTEIDWALRRGLPCVWAPSRIVAGAADGPATFDAAPLAAWLGRLLDAVEVRG